jgi:hypothetical protein
VGTVSLYGKVTGSDSRAGPMGIDATSHIRSSTNALFAFEWANFNFGSLKSQNGQDFEHRRKMRFVRRVCTLLTFSPVLHDFIKTI